MKLGGDIDTGEVSGLSSDATNLLLVLVTKENALIGSVLVRMDT